MKALKELITDKIRANLRQLDQGIDLQESGLAQIDIGQTQQGINKVRAGHQVIESTYMDLSDMCDRLEAGK